MAKRNAMTKPRIDALILSILTLGAFSGAAAAGPPSITLKASYFAPAGSVFRDVYGSGLLLGGDVTVPLAGPLDLWAGADWFAKTGHLLLTEEETKVRLIPIYAGLRLELRREKLRPYFGVAAAYFLLHEENPLGSASESGLGLITQAGARARLGGPLWADLFAGYRLCTIRSGGDDTVSAKLDGFSAGLGLSIRF